MSALDSVRLALDAANAEDTEGFLGAFADDAVVDDDGRRFQGLLQIAEWNMRAVIGVRARFRVLAARDVPGGAEAVVQAGGRGRVERRLFAAQVHDGQITHLAVRPDGDRRTGGTTGGTRSTEEDG